MKIMEAVRLKIQTQKKVEDPKITQQVENMHVRHVDSTVEVEEPKVINETVRPTTRTQRKVEVPKITRQIENTHAQRNCNTMEVDRSRRPKIHT